MYSKFNRPPWGQADVTIFNFPPNIFTHNTKLDLFNYSGFGHVHTQK